MTCHVTLSPIMVQTKAPFEVEVYTPKPPFTMMVAPSQSYQSYFVPYGYVAEARRKVKTKMEEAGAAQGMTRTGRVYMPKHLAQGGTSRETAPKPPVMETGTDDLWRNIQLKGVLYS